MYLFRVQWYASTALAWRKLKLSLRHIITFSYTLIFAGGRCTICCNSPGFRCCYCHACLTTCWYLFIKSFPHYSTTWSALDLSTSHIFKNFDIFSGITNGSWYQSLKLDCQLRYSSPQLLQLRFSSSFAIGTIDLISQIQCLNSILITESVRLNNMTFFISSGLQLGRRSTARTNLVSSDSLGRASISSVQQYIIERLQDRPPQYNDLSDAPPLYDTDPAERVRCETNWE